MSGEVPYRGPLQQTLKTADQKVNSFDERELSTLTQVSSLMRDFLDRLVSDFNSLNDNQTPEQLLVDVKARKMANAFINPLHQTVVAAIEKVRKQGSL